MGWDPFGSKAAKKIKQAAAAAAEAAREAAEANAKAFRFNAAVYERNSDVVEEQGYIDEARSRRAGNRFMGEQESAIASSGFDVGVGFQDMKEDTERELDLDAIIIRRQGQFKSADFEAQSELALMNADAAIKAGEAQAKQAILNGAAQAQAAQSSAISGTIGLGLSAVSAFSDARVKTNIERIGQTPNGIGIYTYDYVWGGPRRIGVMAQEVRERFPDAVEEGQDGILMVHYGKIGLPHGYTFAAALRAHRKRLS
jgi:hypothetical protein